MPSVLDQISWIAIGYGVLVTLVAVHAALKWRARPPWLASMVWMLEFLHVVRAVAGVGVVLSGDRPGSMTTYVGYLLTSVALLPLAMRSTTQDGEGGEVGEDGEGVWSVWLIAIAAVAVTVVGWRLMVTQ